MAADDADTPEDLTSYLLKVPSTDWRDWMDTLDEDEFAYERIRELIRDDAGTLTEDRDDETVRVVTRYDAARWQAWVDTVPRSGSIDDRLSHLLERDLAARTADGEDWAYVRQHFDVRQDIFEAFRRSLPDHMAAHERLSWLVEMDVRTITSTGYNDMEERTARLLASRIKHRGSTALSALDNDNLEKVAEEIEHMVEIAGQFDE